MFEKIKALFSKKEKQTPVAEAFGNTLSVMAMESKYEVDDLVGAAKDLKDLLEYYGRRKKQNHRYKGRMFIHFLLSHKHKNLKNTGYVHWQNINQIIQLNQKKVYPYHKNNLRKAMDFFEKEVKGISEINIKH